MTDKKYKSLMKNTGILALSQFSSKILIFLLVPLYTSILSVEEYGVFDLVSTTLELVIPILSINIIDSIMRFLLDKSANKKDVITLGLNVISISMLLGLIIISIIKIFNLIPQIIGYEWIIYLLFFFTLLNQFAIQTAKGLDKIKIMGIASVVGTLVMIISNILFLLVFKQGLLGFYIANTLAQAFQSILILLLIKVWRYVHHTNNYDLLKRMIKYCFPLIINTLAWWVNSALDKFVVTLFLGASANGLLAVAYKLPAILTTIQTIFNQAWQISSVKEMDNNSNDFINEVYVSMNMLMSILCSFIILLTKPLAHILFSKDFYNTWIYVPFLVLSCVINASSGVLGALLGARKDSKTMAISGIVGLVSNFILNIFLVWLIGIQGATIATVISSFLMYLVRMYNLRDMVSKSNSIGIMLTWVIILIQCLITIFVDNIYSYLINSLIIILIVIFNYKSIKNLIKKLLGGMINA